MGQKLAAFDSSGNITAFYDTVDSPAPVGVATLAITDEQWHACLAAQGYTVQSGKLVAPTPPTAAQQLANAQVSLCSSIDAAADAAYAAIGGSSPGRIAEYQQAKDDATAFKAAGYAGTAPATVACWAQAKGWTAQQACDDILATAAAWAQALVNIRTARLTGKGNVTDAADVAAAQSAADTAIANIRAVPAGL